MNDEQMIWERYKLISEVPATLEFMGDDPEITDKLKSEYKPVQKNSRKIINEPKSRKTDINAWSSEKARELMKSTVQTGTAKGLDRRRQTQGKPPLLWRLIDANLEKESKYDSGIKHIINKSDIQNLVEGDPSIKKRLSSPNGITVIMTPSGQEERSGIMAFSSWIRSHKCGHAILAHRENVDIDNNIRKVLKDYHTMFKESLSIYGDPSINLYDYPILKNITTNNIHAGKYYRDPENFYMDFFTFGSARNKQLIVSDMKEELVAQLMQTGKITFNQMIDEKMFKKMESWFADFNIKNLINIEEYIADQIDTAIENCIGDILYDIV
jgi:hypothetical protein